MPGTVYSHEMPAYRARHDRLPPGDRDNGAWWYSHEIVDRMVPAVETDRPWVTVNYLGACEDRAIVFVHANDNPPIYSWLRDFRDLVMVCSTERACRWAASLGTPVLLPLSVDLAEVRSHARPKDRDVAWCGRAERRHEHYVPDGIDLVEGLPRARFLDEMARYLRVYAVDRCAVEAKALGCEVIRCPGGPDPGQWRVLDTLDAAAMLQDELDRIDGR